MQFTCFRDLEMALKRRVYNLENGADGKVLVWDNQTRQYVGHVDMNQAASEGFDLIKYLTERRLKPGTDWGSNGW